MILYRSVGLQELELIYDSGMKAFSARLPQQPIFYPVLDLEYARQTASGWNATRGEFAGYVTQFKVEDEYIGQLEEHAVGGTPYQEFWIPSEEMEEFNRHITGHIKVLEAYFGDAFEGFIPGEYGLKGKNAGEQFTLLANSYLYKRMDFYLEIKRNHKAVFLNYPFWQQYNFKNPGLKEKIIQAIKEAWLTSFPKTPLPLPPPAQENTSPIQQVESRALNIHVQEESAPVDQTDSYSLVNLEDEDDTVAEEAGIDSDEDEISPVEPAKSQVPVSPLQDEVTLSKRPAPHFLGNRVGKTTRRIEHPESHFIKGIELGLRGAYREAIDELSRAVEADPGHAAAHVSLGVAFHRLGEDDRALSCYETALRIDPKHAEAHYFRANILYKHGDVREAIADYTTAIGLYPALIEAHQHPSPQDRLTDYNESPAGIYRIARPAQRILELNKALETHPRRASLYKERAAEYHRLSNYEQAIADYSSSLRIQPDDADALHFRGAAYEQLGQSDRALQDYQQAAASDAQLSDLYIQRGVSLGSRGNFRQSIVSLTEGIRLAPRNPDGYFNRGMTYFQQGDLESAIADFAKVIQLASNDEDAYYWRGISYEEAGRLSEAIDDYRQFLRISQNPRAREEIEQRLSQWSGNRQDRNPDDRQTTREFPSEKRTGPPDVHDLLLALGERVLDSIWLGSGVDCTGEKAKELYSFTDHNRPIPGHDLLSITEGVRQTREGDFQAFDPGADTYWIYIRAWEGNGFYIETNDPKSRKRLKNYFPSIEEVEGAPPPYEGLLIRV